MHILFQEVLIAAIQMMFVFLIEHQGRPMCFSFLVLSAQLFMQNSQISTTKSDSLKMFVLFPFFFVLFLVSVVFSVVSNPAGSETR